MGVKAALYVGDTEFCNNGYYTRTLKIPVW